MSATGSRALTQRPQDTSGPDFTALALARQRAEEALRESEAQLAAELEDIRLLQDISAQLIEGGDQEALYEKIVDAVAAIMRSDFATMQMLRPERGPFGELGLLASRGLTPEQAKVWEWVRRDTDSTCGQVLRTGKRAIAPDVITTDFLAGTPGMRALLDAGIRAAQSTPLYSRQGRLLGMISSHWREPHMPTERDLRLLDILARQAADLIERALVEDALRESQAQLQSLVNQAPVGIYLVDSALRICEVNPAARSFFGAIQDPVGRGVEDVMRLLWPKSVADEVVALFKRTLETGESYQAPERIEQRLDRKVTEYYDWQIHRVPLPDGRHGVACYFRDISAQVQARRALEASDRHKDEFLAMLAHELRNPLAPIGHASDILLRMLSEDARAQTMVGLIKRQTTHLTRLVDDLLDVSRVTQGRIQLENRPLDVESIIAQAIETVEPQLRQKQHRLSVSTSSNDEPLYVLGDFARLVQCVVNLLTNAAKYTDAGGEIQLRTRAEKSGAVIEVADTGVGISSELLPRVFDLFVQSDRTLDRAQGGLGIGLAVVKRLIQMHGGEIAARSAGIGFGATFEIRLPRIERPQLAAAPAPPIRTPLRRVLVVDDNADAARSLALLLSMQGHQTEAVFSGREALERIETFRPEVALLDIGLPEMDGYELAQRLRAKGGLNELRLIAVSGYGQPSDRHRSCAAGFNEHLVKPVDLSALESALAGEAGNCELAASP